MVKKSARSPRAVLLTTAVVVAGLVAAAQLSIVARAGTDIPFQDQWDVEGRWLYPRSIDGTLRWSELLRSYNEHCIVWTHLVNVALFRVNGQWDPLVQLVAGAAWHAIEAALLFLVLAREMTTGQRVGLAAIIILACVPVLGWANALWGFQSQIYFTLIFSIVALDQLLRAEADGGSAWRGWLAALAAWLAMSAGIGVPVAFLGVLALRAVENRGRYIKLTDGLVAAGYILMVMTLRTKSPELAEFRARSVGEFFEALGAVLAWPHAGWWGAALVMNLPLALVVVGRIGHWRTARRGEDIAIGLGVWALAIGAAAAWSRAHSDDFGGRVPWRYVDFCTLLVIANIWCAFALAGAIVLPRRPLGRVLAGAWGTFVLVGWVSLSIQVTRGVLLPRSRDREAPVRLVRAFQATGDAGVFASQPRLLVPHPNPESVRAVLSDPLMRGRLPPSLQPGQPLGPLSRAVRWILW